MIFMLSKKASDSNTYPRKICRCLTEIRKIYLWYETENSKNHIGYFARHSVHIDMHYTVDNIGGHWEAVLIVETDRIARHAMMVEHFKWTTL